MSTEDEKLLKEAKKLPWDEQLQHKNWKVRNDANNDLAALRDSITDHKDARLREFDAPQMPWSAAPTEPLCDAAAAVVAARRGMEPPLTAVAEAFEELARGMEADGEELRLAPFGDTCALVSVLFSCLGIAFKKGHGIDAKFLCHPAASPSQPTRAPSRLFFSFFPISLPFKKGGFLWV